ncbi:MAG TPA: TlpA disulfide reductase family protein [Acidimicrobiia bacterium]|nr:TlpA disulfide reductase family protein [Acidimicrobiia bacterium]
MLVVVLAVAGVTWWSVRDDGDTGTASPAAPGSQIGSLAEPGVAQVGEPAPDFALTTLDGGTVRLSDLRGTPVVLNFWASWCVPCREEFPVLAAADHDAHGDYAVVGVNTRDNLRSDAKSFAREEHATWQNGYDADESVRKAYGVVGLPQTFFIRADGTIAARVLSTLDDQLVRDGLAKIT